MSCFGWTYHPSPVTYTTRNLSSPSCPFHLFPGAFTSEQGHLQQDLIGIWLYPIMTISKISKHRKFRPGTQQISPEARIAKEQKCQQFLAKVTRKWHASDTQTFKPLSDLFGRLSDLFRPLSDLFKSLEWHPGDTQVTRKKKSISVTIPGVKKNWVSSSTAAGIPRQIGHIFFILQFIPKYCKLAVRLCITPSHHKSPRIYCCSQGSGSSSHWQSLLVAKSDM